MSVFSGNSAPLARPPLQLPVQVVVSSRGVLASTPRNAAICTPTDAGTSWRRTICPWAPERKSSGGMLPENAGSTPAASPMSCSTPAGLAKPVNFWPAPSSWSGEYGSTPTSIGSVHTPQAGTLYRTSSCPWAPERRPAPRFRADSAGGTPVGSQMGSPVGLTTPVNFWPGTPVNGGGSRSLPLRGPLVRLMHSSSTDTTPVAGMRPTIQNGSRSMPLTSMCSKSYRDFEGLTPMSVDATPINHEVSPSVAGRNSDWLNSFLAETPTASLNHARFLDSQPSTPVSMSWPITPKDANAFGMSTVEEDEQAMSPEEVPLASPQAGVVNSASIDEHKQEEDGWMPPAESIMGGA